MNIKDRIQKSCVLQHDSADCGAACLVSVIRYYGGSTTIEEIRTLSGTTNVGTTMLGLYQAANEYGLDAAGYEADIGSIINYGKVLILHVRIAGNQQHYIICFGFGHGRFMIWDPSKGYTTLTAEELDTIWISKKCLGIEPNDKFMISRTANKGRFMKWIIKTISPEKDLLLTSFIIGILISALGLVMAIYTQKLIDIILPKRQINFLILTGILVFILLSSRTALAAIRQLLLLTQGKALNIRVVDEFYGSLFSLPKLFFDSRKTGDFIARLNDTMRIQKVIADIIGVYLIDILIIITIVISVFFYSVGVGLIVVVSLPFFYLTVSSRNTRLKEYQNMMMQGYSINESNFIDTLKGIDQIRNLNWNDHYIRKSKAIYTDYQERILTLGRLKIRLNLIVGLCGSVFLMLILIYSSVEVIRSRLTQGELMAVLSLVSTLLPSMINTALLGIPVSEARVAMNRMFELTSIKKEDDTGSESSPGFRIDQLRLEKISFRYPGQKILLENIDLTVRKGEVVSLVGENGCGKSTLANIILRFYRNESGNLTVNGGVPSDAVTLKDWRSGIGFIPQEIHIFNGTILQNLLTDYSEESIKDVVSLVKDLGLDGFIEGFPDGFLTLVGEEGINLSGGQKQLLAYIRALIAKPGILVIDEGTSNMDTKTEGLIMDLLERLKADTGILMITHRLNLVRKLSDSICIISDRTIKSAGDHESLMQTDNFYKRYWEACY